jgi:hypothetical protein
MPHDAEHVTHAERASSRLCNSRRRDNLAIETIDPEPRCDPLVEQVLDATITIRKRSAAPGIELALSDGRRLSAVRVRQMR